MRDEPASSSLHLPVPLQRSKLVAPVIRAVLVPRPALLERLDRLRTRRVAVMRAPAGHGKTITVAKWLRRRKLAAAWVTVDAGDELLTRLALHMAFALDAHVPGAAARLMALLTRPDAPTSRALGEAFGGILHETGLGEDAASGFGHEVILVLDDFHLAATEEACAFLAGLLQSAPRSLRLIVTTRHRFPLPLARLRAEDDLVEVNGVDLRFSVEDVARLFALESGTALKPESAAEVHRAIGGWPAAARLLALDRRRHDASWAPAAPDAVDGSHLIDYLTEQVLAQLTPPERDMVLLAALPARFSADLLHALAAQNRLDLPVGFLPRLFDLDLFRAADADGAWFTFHPLFHSALRAMLKQVDAARLDTWRRQCAAWFASRHLTGEALTQLVAIGDFAAAGALVAARTGPAFDREDWQSVAEWLALLPEAEIARNTELLLSRAWVAYLGGRAGATGGALARLREVYAQPETRAVQQAEIDILWIAARGDYATEPEATIARAASARAAMDPQRRYRLGFALLIEVLAMGSAGRTEDALQTTADFTERESARIDAASIRGYLARCFILWQMGARDLVAQTARDMRELALAHDLPISVGWAEVYLGHAAFEVGQWAEAEQHYHQVIAGAFHLHAGCVREAFVGQILVYQAQGQLEQADAALARFRAVAREANFPEPLAFADSLAARLALIRGDLGRARAWAFTARVADDSAAIRATHHPALTRARILLATGDPRQAATILQAFVAQAARIHYVPGQISALASLAEAQEALGAPDHADGALREALALAAPESLMQRILLSVIDVTPILRRLRDDPEIGWFAEQLLLAGMRRGDGGPPQAAQPLLVLTPREQDVLGCLSERMTNSEIGAALFISPVTAKNYVTRLCARFDASNRREVVTRAREMGLLPGPR